MKAGKVTMLRYNFHVALTSRSSLASYMPMQLTKSLREVHINGVV